MSRIAGIDLGTTNSLIGVVDSGFPILLADEHGRRITPSVVHYPPGAPPFAGIEATRLLPADPANTITSVKRLMGARTGDVTASDLPFPISEAPGSPITINTRAGSILPEDVSSQILLRLKRIGEHALGEDITRAVITVPAYFNDAQRAATKRAGEAAGFSVERILNEPTAAALAYGLDKQFANNRARIAVYDLGGGTFDLSILELRGNVFEVLATNGNTRLGGDDIDAALANVLADRAQQHIGRPLSPIGLARIRESARTTKEALSEATEHAVTAPFLEGTKSFECVVFRAELEALAQPIVERTRAHCIRALADAKLGVSDLHAVILVGGMTRMPLVRAFVADFFGCEPDTSQNPDEAVALGATIQAGLLEGTMSDMLLLDVTPLSLGIETFGGLMNVIIPRNSTIPIKAGEMFTNAVPNQKSVLVHVLQGERELARDNWSLGRFEVDVSASRRGSARVGVQFEIDQNGILHVLARDTKSGSQRVVELTSAVNISDEAVEKMIAESLDNAIEDVNQRRIVEMKLKAKEMIPATRNALEIVTNLEPEEQSSILAALDRLERMPAAATHAELKDAVDALDAATQSLAARVLEALSDRSHS